MNVTLQPRRRGRPRDSSIDDRVLDATRQLLVEVGFSATTIQAIADRSGVPNSAIYRRWPSRVQLIEAAATPQIPDLGSQTGELAYDLRRFESALRKALASPVTRAALPSLLAAYQAGHSGRPAAFRMRESWRPQFYDLLDAAGPEQVDAAVNRDDLFDLLLGSILVEAFVPTTAQRPTQQVETTPLLIRLVGPRPDGIVNN